MAAQENVQENLGNGLGASSSATSACTFCKKPATESASGSCKTMDAAVFRNLFLCLQLCDNKDELEELTKLTLPLCVVCRDKLVFMSYEFQQYMQHKFNFETTRNSFIFGTIESKLSEPPLQLSSGPEDGIRAQILERWMSLYEDIKQVSNGECETGDSN